MDEPDCPPGKNPLLSESCVWCASSTVEPIRSTSPVRMEARVAVTDGVKLTTGFIVETAVGGDDSETVRVTGEGAIGCSEGSSGSSLASVGVTVSEVMVRVLSDPLAGNVNVVEEDNDSIVVVRMSDELEDDDERMEQELVGKESDDEKNVVLDSDEGEEVTTKHEVGLKGSEVAVVVGDPVAETDSDDTSLEARA